MSICSITFWMMRLTPLFWDSSLTPRNLKIQLNFPIKGTWGGLVLPQAGFEPSDESMQFFELV